jgi:hypothetical protein
VKIKTRYREKSAEEIPDHDEITRQLIDNYQNPEPIQRQLNEPHAQPAIEPLAQPDTGIQEDETAGDNPAVTEAMEQQAEADNARDVLLRQFEVMRRSEQLQHQMATAPRIPRTEHELRAAWRSQGVSDKEADFLFANPHMVARPNQLQQAVSEARTQGVERDSEKYFAAIQDAFERQMGERADKKAKKAAMKGKEPVPEFFTPPPPAREESGLSPSILSAPVSREGGAGIGGRAMSPTSIRLTPAEREAAHMAGISDTEYARQKLILLARQSRESWRGARVALIHADTPWPVAGGLTPA